MYLLLVFHSFANNNSVDRLQKQASQTGTERPENRLVYSEFYEKPQG